MPLLGLIPFLPERCRSFTECKVSMPLLGLIPFLQCYLTKNLTTCISVNALTRAYPISTLLMKRSSLTKLLVSMPLLGLIPFLPSETEQPEETEQPCVNALTRAFPISTKWQKSVGKGEQMQCQCPYSGLSHFYAILVVAVISIIMCVNALTRAYPISTSGRWRETWVRWRVSMPLLGLIPFLRYPFKNPLKSMVSGPVFRG